LQLLQLLLEQVEQPSELGLDNVTAFFLKLTAETNFLIFTLLHFLQATGELLPSTILSNFAPHVKH